MKTFKKFMVGILAIVATLGGVGCNSPQGINPVEEVDTTRTQLYVSNYNGGYGDMWLRAAKTRFEEEFAEVSFETGKKGVQVMIDNAKESADAIKDKLAYSRNQVIFQEGIDYYEYVQKGVALDITDMIKETLPGETESIYDKMTPEQKEGLKITTADGKDHYFMVPHYESFYGVVVDLDLLDSKRLMLGSDGEFNYKTTDTAMLSKGPDGKDGTYDDGFPATYAEFKALCTNMVERGVTPFGWSGEFQMYITNAMMAWSADTMGAEETNINLTMEGTSHLLVKSVDSNGNPVLESKEITPESG